MESTKQPTVLLVDDEQNIRDAVAFTLKREGFNVITAATGPTALDQIRHRPDVVLLDVMLPGFDGFEVLRRIRTTSHVPVIMLSAKGEEIDRVLGLELGADDYITKPFAMRELIARVRAIVRRVSILSTQSVPEVAELNTDKARSLAVAGLRIDIPGRTVTKNNQVIDLNPKEFDTLVYFFRHPGVVLSREALLREVWGYAHTPDTRTVDVHIRWLRAKLEDNPAEPRLIVTVRGAGYRFTPDDSRGDA